MDLAGSERQKKTKAEGDRLKEGKVSVLLPRCVCARARVCWFQCCQSLGSIIASEIKLSSSHLWL